MKKAIEHSLEELELAKFDLEKCFNTKSKSFTFNTCDLSLNYFDEKIAPNISIKKSVVYIIKVNDNYDLTNIFEKYKSENNDVKLSKINKRNKESKVLYVGSVLSNFKGRLKQHLGFGSKSTYSLKMNKWATTKKLEITIEYFLINDFSSELTIRILEKKLAVFLKPQFGKH
jgi:hypothetical protein